MSSKTLYLLSNQTLTLWIIDTLLSEDRFIQRSTKIDIKWAIACHEIWNSETQFWKEFSFLVEIFKKHFGWKPTFHTLCHKTENLSFSLEGVTIETWSQPRRDVLRVCRNEIQSIFHFLTASSSFKMAWQRLLMQIIIQTQIISCGFMQRYQKPAQGFLNRRIFTNSKHCTKNPNLCTFLLFLSNAFTFSCKLLEKEWKNQRQRGQFST